MRSRRRAARARRRRLAVIDPKKYSMNDAVAFMTGATVPPEADAARADAA